MLKCLLKGETRLWIENIGNFSVGDDTISYEQTVAKLQKAFYSIKDKSPLRREFYCNK